MRHAEHKAPRQQDGKRPGAHDEQEPRDENRGGGYERRREPARHQRPCGHGCGHARKAESGRGHPQLPVGERLRPADLRQEGAEGAHTEGVTEEEHAEEAGPVEPEEAPLTPHLKERSPHHG